MDALFWFLFGLVLGSLLGWAVDRLIQMKREASRLKIGSYKIYKSKCQRRRNMKNYVCINENKIELTDEQVAQIGKSVFPAEVKLSQKKVGDTFKIGEYEFIVLEHSKETTAVILKDILCESKFGERDCDFKSSIVKKKLGEFEGKIAKIIGSHNIVPHGVDLTSNDGLKDYGKDLANMSLLTADLYRRYVEILDNYKVEEWWWLATPYSTAKHGYTQYVLCVAPSGVYDCNDYGCNIGVRPFCILNSNIFVS